MRAITRALALAAVLALSAGACSDDGDGTSTTVVEVEESGGTSTVVDQDLSPEMTNVAPDGLQVVSTDAGDVLALSDGTVIYVFTPDTDAAGSSACTDGCVDLWPPVEPSQAATYDAAELGEIERPDGSPQATVNGQPVYTYSADLQGDASGQGVGGVWWTLTADGQPNETT